MNRAFGGHRSPVICAHVGHLAEPLMFAPAFIAVGWALASSWRREKTTKERHD